MQARWSTVAMAAFGVLVGHGVAYAGPAAADHPHTAAHDYLDGALVVTAPFAALGLFLLVAAEVRRAHRLRTGSLLLVQVVLFVLQESVERAAVGLPLSGLLGDPALWLGLGAQLVLAVLAVLTVRAAARVIRRPRGRSSLPAAPRIAGILPALPSVAPFGGVGDRPAARSPPPPILPCTVARPRRDHDHRIPAFPASARGRRPHRPAPRLLHGNGARRRQ